MKKNKCTVQSLKPASLNSVTLKKSPINLLYDLKGH